MGSIEENIEDYSSAFNSDNPKANISMTLCDKNKESKKLLAHTNILTIKNCHKLIKDLNNANAILYKQGYEVVYNLFYYIYTNKFEADHNIIRDLLNLGKYYEIPNLEIECKSWIMENLNNDNVCDYLVLLKSERSQKIIHEENLKFVRENYKRIIESENFKNCDSKLLKELIEIDDIDISEVEILKYLLIWAETQCINKKISTNIRNKRIILGDLIKLIRFPTMAIDDFCNLIKSQPDILNSDEFRSIVLSIVLHENNSMGFITKPRQELPPKQCEMKEETNETIIIENNSEEKELELQKNISNSNFMDINEFGYCFKELPITTIKFYCDKDILLIGYRVTGFKDEETARITVYSDNIKLSECSGQVGSSISTAIYFDKPILIKADTNCKILTEYDLIDKKYWCNVPQDITQFDKELELEKLSQTTHKIYYKITE